MLPSFHARLLVKARCRCTASSCYVPSLPTGLLCVRCTQVWGRDGQPPAVWSAAYCRTLAGGHGSLRGGAPAAVLGQVSPPLCVRVCVVLVGGGRKGRHGWRCSCCVGCLREHRLATVTAERGGEGGRQKPSALHYCCLIGFPHLVWRGTHSTPHPFPSPPPHPTTLPRYDVLEGLRPGGTVLINAPWRNFEELEAHMHPRTRARLAQLRPKVGPLTDTELQAAVASGASCAQPRCSKPGERRKAPPQDCSRRPAALCSPYSLRSSTLWTPAPWRLRLGWAAASTWSCRRLSLR